MAIRPIMLNPTIEKVEPPGQFEPRGLAFKPLSVDELLRAEIPQLEAFLGALYQSAGGATASSGWNVCSALSACSVDATRPLTRPCSRSVTTLRDWTR